MGRPRVAAKGASQLPPLDPAVIRLIDALANAQAVEDHEAEQRERRETPTRPRS